MSQMPVLEASSDAGVPFQVIDAVETSSTGLPLCLGGFGLSENVHCFKVSRCGEVLSLTQKRELLLSHFAGLSSFAVGLQGFFC